MNIEKTIEEGIATAKTPGKAMCPVCNEELFSPMDKLSIALYGKCTDHIEIESPEESNLTKIIETFF